MLSTSFYLWKACVSQIASPWEKMWLHPAFSYKMNAFPVRNFQQGQSSLLILGPTWQIIQLTFVLLCRLKSTCTKQAINPWLAIIPQAYKYCRPISRLPGQISLPFSWVSNDVFLQQ